MVFATTLGDSQKYYWQEVAGRSNIELRLRDVKKTLKMERLRVKTLKMARKTLAVCRIAYNLVKTTCREAGHGCGTDPAV